MISKSNLRMHPPSCFVCDRQTWTPAYRLFDINIMERLSFCNRTHLYDYIFNPEGILKKNLNDKKIEPLVKDGMSLEKDPENKYREYVKFMLEELGLSEAPKVDG